MPNAPPAFSHPAHDCGYRGGVDVVHTRESKLLGARRQVWRLGAKYWGSTRSCACGTRHEPPGSPGPPRLGPPLTPQPAGFWGPPGWGPLWLDFRPQLSGGPAPLETALAGP